MLNHPELRRKYRLDRMILGILPPNTPHEEEHQNHPVWQKVAFLGFLVGICLIGSCNPAHAEVTEDQAVRILVGEAANQGKIGMICVAEVLRRQGSVKGFYGLKAKHSHKEPKWVWEMARAAWKQSKTTNYTHLANHFENINAFGCPSWVKGCIEVFRYKDHVFYREVV